MYELPSDFDPSVFVGRRLELVSFSENTLRFDFDGPDAASVTAEGAVSHGTRGQPLKRFDVPNTETTVVQAVGHLVQRVAASDRIDLLLAFDDGQVIVVHGDSEWYEMYSISIGSRRIIV
jgi:hypothetical protein